MCSGTFRYCPQVSEVPSIPTIPNPFRSSVSVVVRAIGYS